MKMIAQLLLDHVGVWLGWIGSRRGSTKTDVNLN